MLVLDVVKYFNRFFDPTLDIIFDISLDRSAGRVWCLTPLALPIPLERILASGAIALYIGSRTPDNAVEPGQLVLHRLSA